MPWVCCCDAGWKLGGVDVLEHWTQGKRESMAAGEAAARFADSEASSSPAKLLEPAVVMAEVAPDLGRVMLGLTSLVAAFVFPFVALNGLEFHNLAGGIAIVVTGFAYVLLRAGRPLVAIRLMVWSLWLLVAAWAFLIAGIRTPLLFAIPFLIMLGGWFLTRRETVLMAAATVALLTLLAWGESAGWLAIRIERGAWAWWFTMVPLVLLGALVTVSLRRRLLRHHGRVAELTRQIVHLARHDPLTGLFNRSAMMEILAGALARASRGNHLVAVLFIDLDDFKLINDKHGHGVGDHVLAEVAERLGQEVRVSDAVARFGGDEFVAVLTDLADLEAVDNAVQRVRASLHAPVALDGGRAVAARASIGVAVMPRDGMDAEALIRHADADMYHAKARRPA